MPVAYLTAAVFSGIIMTLLWLFAGGGWLSAILVYVLSGNLVVVGLMVRVYMRASDEGPMPHDDQTPRATKV